MEIMDRSRQLEALDNILGHVQNQGIPPIMRIMMIHDVTGEVIKEINKNIKNYKGLSEQLIGSSEDFEQTKKFVMSKT